MVEHARATYVGIEVAVEGSEVVVTVDDDGVGLAMSSRSSGLANLQHRAAERSGSLSVATGAGGIGSRLSWRVPLR